METVSRSSLHESRVDSFLDRPFGELVGEAIKDQQSEAAALAGDMVTEAYHQSEAAIEDTQPYEDADSEELTKSTREQIELYQGMEQTRSIIISRLEQCNEDPYLLDPKQVREYQWDLWMINGVLDHELKFKDLEIAKRSAISLNLEPDFTYFSFK